MRFMVNLRFQTDDPTAMRAHIPREQAHVRELTEQGTIHGLYLAADGSRGWMVLQGHSDEHVQDLLEDFPLRPYMDVEVVPLR